MIIFGREKTEMNFRMLSTPVFRDYRALIFEIFVDSRKPENRLDAEGILKIQARLANVLRLFQDEHKIQKSKSDKFGIFICRRLMRITRTVGDGIAWRNLGFRREWMKVLAHNKRNHINDDMKGLLQAASVFVPNYRAIICDVTETARIGDIIFIRDGEPPLLAEAKKSKKFGGLPELHSLANHNEKLLPGHQLDKMFDTNAILVSNGISRINTDFLLTDVRRNYYFKKVETAIRNVNRLGVQTDRLNKHMSIQVFAPAVAFPSPSQGDRASSILEKQPGDRIRRLSNYDLFFDDNNDFLSGIVPYSALPFSDDVCMGLITGEVLIRILCNLDGLYRDLRECGWNVKEAGPDQSEPDVRNEVLNFYGKFGEFNGEIDDAMFVLEKDDGFWGRVPVNRVFSGCFEFSSLMSISDEFEFLRQHSKANGKVSRGHSLHCPSDKLNFL